MDLKCKVMQYIEKQHMLTPGDQVVVGLSGGADSVCLLLVLVELREKQHFTLHAVHVNHQIRGVEADRDEKFSKELCKKWNVPCTVVTKDVPALAKSMGLTEEEAGRKVRYQAFSQLAEKLEQQKNVTGKVKIAVAHHKNDQAETMLHHLCRGTDVAGLAGIPPMRGRIIRPLLCVTRGEIEAYLRENEQSYQTDSTNLSEEYTRNRIRRQIVPCLEEYINQNAVEHMAEVAESLGEVTDFLEQTTQQIYEKAVKMTTDEAVLTLWEFQNQHPVIKRWIIKKILKELSGTHKNIEKTHIMSTVALIEKQVGRRISLPYGITVWREHETLCFQKKQDSDEKNNQEYQIPEEGECVLPTEKICIQTRILPVEHSEDVLCKIPKNNCTKWFDYDKIDNTVIFRKIRKEDYLQLDESGHHKLVKRVCKDAKISAREREHMWIVADGDHAMWIPGVRMSAYYKVTKQTRRILEIRYVCLEERGECYESNRDDFPGKVGTADQRTC